MAFASTDGVGSGLSDNFEGVMTDCAWGTRDMSEYEKAPDCGYSLVFHHTIVPTDEALFDPKPWSYTCGDPVKGFVPCDGDPEADPDARYWDPDENDETERYRYICKGPIDNPSGDDRIQKNSVMGHFYKHLIDAATDAGKELDIGEGMDAESFNGLKCIFNRVPVKGALDDADNKDKIHPLVPTMFLGRVKVEGSTTTVIASSPSDIEQKMTGLVLFAFGVMEQDGDDAVLSKSQLSKLAAGKGPLYTAAVEDDDSLKFTGSDRALATALSRNKTFLGKSELWALDGEGGLIPAHE